MRLLNIFNRKRKSRTQAPAPPLVQVPPGCSLVHITHQKAASQWFRRILRDAFGNAVVEPDTDSLIWFERGIVPGKVYPCVHVMPGELKAILYHDDVKRCVIIRDLRDTAVSAYFSLAGSHAVETPGLKRWRLTLSRLSKEEGLMLVIERYLPNIAMKQRTWLESGEDVLRVEDFFERPKEMFALLFRDYFQVPLDLDLLERLLAKHNFQTYAKGRP